MRFRAFLGAIQSVVKEVLVAHLAFSIRIYILMRYEIGSDDAGASKENNCGRGARLPILVVVLATREIHESDLII